MKLYVRNIIVWALLLSIFSCKEENNRNISATTIVKQTLQKDSILIAPQEYNTLLNDLVLNKKILESKKVASYIATVHYKNKNNTSKILYHQIAEQAHGITMYEVVKQKNAIDTFVSETLLQASENAKSYLQKTNTTGKYVSYKRIQYYKNKVLHKEQKINISNNTVQDVVYTYNTNELSTIYYVKLNSMEYFVKSADKEFYYYIKNKKDTIRKYEQTVKDNVIERNYTQGMFETYSYFYTGSSLTKLVWKNNGRPFVTITFDYTANGLLKTRTVTSFSKSIENSVTEYSYMY